MRIVHVHSEGPVAPDLIEGPTVSVKEDLQTSLQQLLRLLLGHGGVLLIGVS